MKYGKKYIHFTTVLEVTDLIGILTQQFHSGLIQMYGDKAMYKSVTSSGFCMFCSALDMQKELSNGPQMDLYHVY